MANNNSKFEQMLNDPDFLSLPESEQNSMVDEMRQQDFGAVPRTESFLKNAMRVGTKTAGAMFSQPKFDPQHPFQSAIASTTGFQGAPGMASYQMAERGKGVLAEEVAPDNPLGQMAFSVASDPTTYIGAGGAAKGLKGAISNLKNPSKAFGQGITKLQEASPKQRVDFLGIIRNSMNNSKAAKVLEKSGVIEKYGGTKLTSEGTISENLSNLTLQESQDFVNSIKDGVRIAVKEGNVKPTEIPIAKMFSELSKAQRSAFQGFRGVQKRYGISKTIGKSVSKYGKTAATGAALAAGGSAAAAALKPFLWK